MRVGNLLKDCDKAIVTIRIDVKVVFSLMSRIGWPIFAVVVGELKSREINLRNLTMILKGNDRTIEVFPRSWFWDSIRMSVKDVTSILSENQ